jgi:hypothetical protein
VHEKCTAEVKTLDEVENRAAKLRKVTANNKNESEYDEEIDIDDEDETVEQYESQAGVHNVKTKAIPPASFGGLVTQVKDTSG